MQSSWPFYRLRNTVSPSIIKNNTDFQFYNELKELWQKEQNIDILRPVENSAQKEELAAWRLDKYKFIHVLEKTWAMQPDMDWYLLIDADTYLLCMRVYYVLELDLSLSAARRLSYRLGGWFFQQLLGFHLFWSDLSSNSLGTCDGLTSTFNIP